MLYQLLLISHEPANNIHQCYKQTSSDLSVYLWPSLVIQERFLVIETSFRVPFAVCAMARNEIEHIHAEPTYGFSAKPSVSLPLFLNCLKARMWNTGTVILEKKENASDVEWRMCQAVLKMGVHTDIKRWIFNSIQRGKPSIAKLSNLIPFDKSTLVLNKTSILNIYRPAFPRFSYKKYC